MNIGERHEILFKIYVVVLRDNGGILFGEEIKNVGSRYKEYGSLPYGYTLEQINQLEYYDLLKIARHMGIEKASNRAKADVYINGHGVSLKSLNAAPAAIINHTTRPGFEFVCNYLKISIECIDYCVYKYWYMRKRGLISEDTKIKDYNCPFKKYKENLKPILEYFLFDGTGSGLSREPAEYIIKFDDPLNPRTYMKINKCDAVEHVWNKLIFSIRQKGMPRNFSDECIKFESIARWVECINGNFKGALHVRVSD